jgi:hypothetical protein
MIAIAVLAVFMVLGIMVLLGLTPDTRDPQYGLGPFFARRAKPDEAKPRT